MLTSGFLLLFKRSRGGSACNGEGESEVGDLTSHRQHPLTMRATTGGVAMEPPPASDKGGGRRSE